MSYHQVIDDEEDTDDGEDTDDDDDDGGGDGDDGGGDDSNDDSDDNDSRRCGDRSGDIMTMIIAITILMVVLKEVTGSERADRLAKSGSKQLQPMSTSTYQEAKTLLRNRQKCQWKRATGDYNLSTDPINRLARHEQTTIFKLRTGHLWPASAPEVNWHHGLCTLRLQRRGTDGPPHPPRLSRLAETETPVMAAG